MRWLVLDEVLMIERKGAACSRSHVPDQEFSAELLLIEMMAQTGALLLGLEKDFSDDVIFAKIEVADFCQPMKPGESIQIKATSENIRSEGSWIDGEVFNQTGALARARLLLMNVGHLLPGETKPITFHKAFMDHFKIREKIK